jgi:hypothetical protein
MKKKIIVSSFLLAFNSLCQTNNSTSKTFTEKLEGIKTSSKELTKSSSTDNSSVGQSGIMSTSIPLITVNSRTMTFPIELQYTSGIKVDQYSGPVGLGWTMPIGSIVRDYGAFQPDYSSTLHEGDMDNVQYLEFLENNPTGNWTGFTKGWLNAGTNGMDPSLHQTYLGYDIVPVDQRPIPLSDFYQVNVPGLESNSFWNGGLIGGTHNWKLTEHENWRITHSVRTYSGNNAHIDHPKTV